MKMTKRRATDAARLRARVLAEWRGLGEWRERTERETTAADSVFKLMESLGLAERLKSAEVLSAWREIAGDFFAKHAEPRMLKDRILYVSVLQPTVHFELDRVWKREILAKFKERFGARTIKEIRFRVG